MRAVKNAVKPKFLKCNFSSPDAVNFGTVAKHQ